MYDSIHFEEKKLLVNHLGYLRKHDLVYKSPAYEGWEAIPLGNGDTACMLWNTTRTMELVINKSDAIDFNEDGELKAWAWEAEENNSAIVSCGQLSISDGMPSFDWLYLYDFEQRLNIAEACNYWTSSTPFSKWNSRIFVSKPDDVIVMDIQCSSEEPVERTIQLERWGTRNFFHYYELLVRDPSLKLGGICSGEQDGCIYLKQDLRGTSFVISAKLIAEDYKVRQNSSRCMEYVLSRSIRSQFKVLVTVVTGKEEDPLVDVAVNKLNAAAQKFESLFHAHREYWKTFWEKSFIHLVNDDYLENIYYMNLYQLNSCAAGKYPPLFSGGLWTWNHDLRNWGHYYHWNQQQTYWGIHASNHPELIENYLDLRFNMLPNAINDAKKVFNKKGAFFSDICNPNGYQAFEPDTLLNYTVGPQIAMDFYRHFKYSGDMDFLRNRAYPFMKACAEFYCDSLEMVDGVYHIAGGATAYESYWALRDTTTDHSMFKALFSSLIEAAGILSTDDAMVEVWIEYMDNLYELPVMDYADYTCDAENMKIVSVGTKWDGSSVAYNEGVYPYVPFPASQLSHVFPSGFIGLKDEGTEAFQTTVNTARLIIENDVYQVGGMGCSGITPIPEIAARLGLKDETNKLLNFYVQKYQVFPNGFTHFLNIKDEQVWLPEFKVKVLKGDEKNTRWNMLHEQTDGERIPISSKYHLHAFFESASNIMAGVNEMLLQSYDGVIRVFPAAPDEYEASFTLLATGNYMVTSEKCGRDIRYIHIKSNIGGKCRVYIPWEEEVEILGDGNRLKEFEIKNSILEFETSKGQLFLIQRKAFPITIYYKEWIVSYVNNDIKRNGDAKLGIERRF